MIAYPLFVFAKDDHSMRVIEEEGRILHDLEAIDIQNDEYVFWDASGAGVAVTVSLGRFKRKLEKVAACPSVFSIRDAFMSYAKSLGVAEPIAEGAPMDIWNRLQSEVERRPSKKELLARLLSR